MLEKILSRSGCKKEAAWARFVFQWLAVSLILHIIAAVRSTGFYHPTEHLQILELVDYKLGKIPASELSHDFQQMTLSWMLPALMTGIAKFLNEIGISSPFDWALSYRLFASLFGFLSMIGLTLCCYFWFTEKTARKWAVIALNFIWYLPAFHARHSAENLGGSLFFLGLSLLLLTTPSIPKWHSLPGKSSLHIPFLAGIVFGFAFEIKYDSLFMILGVLLWLLVFARNTVSFMITRTLALLSGSSIPILLGLCVDHWGYDQWTFPALNYFHQEFSQFHIAHFLPSCWHLLKEGAFHHFPPFGILVFLSFFIAWVRHPKHLLTWSLFPLFCCIALLPDPELYRIFPMVHVGGLILILSMTTPEKGFQWPYSWQPNFAVLTRNWKKLERVKWAVAGLNVVALLVLSTTTAWIPIRFYSRLYQFKPYKFLVNYQDHTLFEINGAPFHFYLPTDVPFREFHSYTDLIQSLSTQEGTQWLFQAQSSLPDGAQQLKKWCKPEFSTLPEWIGTCLEKADRSLSSNTFTNWTLYRCQSPSLLRSTLEETEN